MEERIKVIFHPDKFSGHGHSFSRVTVILICHVISQYRVRVMWFYGWEPLLVAIGTFVVEMWCF